MDILKAYSRSALFWNIFIMVIFCILIDIGFLYAMNTWAVHILSVYHQFGETPEALNIVSKSARLADMLNTYFIPISAGVFCFFGFLLWFFQRISFQRIIGSSSLSKQEDKRKQLRKRVEKEDVQEEQKASEQHYFLHLLSVLQREGRLMDFFSEKLDDYDDEQIGAAVRDIHEKCNKTLSKYVTFESILVNQEEESEIVLEEGFDPASIKLTGNVTGNPPFKGIIRHLGWKVKKIQIPDLSSAKNPNIIAPAEVEI